MSSVPESYHITLEPQPTDSFLAWVCWIHSLSGWLMLPVAPIFAVPGLLFGLFALHRLERHPEKGGKDMVRIGLTSLLLQLVLWFTILLLAIALMPQRILVRHILLPL
jgi:hypothetical protein